MKNMLVPVMAALLASCGVPEEYNPVPAPHGYSVRGLEVLVPAAKIPEAGTVQAEAWLILADGTKEPATDAAWESLAPDVLSVEGNGLVHGRAPGQGTIRASQDGMQAFGAGGGRAPHRFRTHPDQRGVLRRGRQR